ncbi:hypothetical protein FHS19_004589 [Paenibacillus rhizosphaerae]|uniref:Uncharacterized protein n=1 Tax=Paenibacillus rhizosphaerae TaxID=297318 RepID=A0A839TS31_9BACL|nr:hypothetical protein [Paenibacillus rhizosphaerae]MBB3129884.1 hypothetical protein [Paenibacillus rhizosphaerae]
MESNSPAGAFPISVAMPAPANCAAITNTESSSARYHRTRWHPYAPVSTNSTTFISVTAIDAELSANAPSEMGQEGIHAAAKITAVSKKARPGSQRCPTRLSSNSNRCDHR